ncbi:hypothetical protein GGI42DRAFT_173028 [Trichoderma sp. SZMC 28013]
MLPANNILDATARCRRLMNGTGAPTNSTSSLHTESSGPFNLRVTAVAASPTGLDCCQPTPKPLHGTTAQQGGLPAGWACGPQQRDCDGGSIVSLSSLQSPAQHSTAQHSACEHEARCRPLPQVGPGVLFVCAGNAMRLRVVEPAVSPAAVADSPAASVQLQQPIALKAARPAARPAFASAALADGDKAQTVVDLNLSSHTMPVPCLIWRCWPWHGAADGSQK